MSLQKQNIPINFSGGLDTKTDDKQVPPGRFLSLVNTVFDKGGLLQKRNGYAELTSLPDTDATFLTTFNGNLTAIGTELQAYSQGSQSWLNKGTIQPAQVSVLPIIRSNHNQLRADSVVAANGFVCTTYADSGGSTINQMYVVTDEVTGQNIVPPTTIQSKVASGTVTGGARVFLLGSYFVIVFTNVISAVPHLQYIAISTVQPTILHRVAGNANINISSQYAPTSTLSFDGVVANNALYFAWNGDAGAQAVRMTGIDSTLSFLPTRAFVGEKADIMSLTADTTGNTPIIYVSYYESSGMTGFTAAINPQVQTVFTPKATITVDVVDNITSSAQNGVCRIFYEVDNNYSYDSAIPTHCIKTNTILMAGTVGSPSTLVRSVGLASKSFIIDGVEYFLAVYQSDAQPTYFLLDQNGKVIVKLAYSNGSGYVTLGLSNISIQGMIVKIPYLIKDLIAAVNKGTNVPAGTPINSVYSQTGINLASINITAENIISAEIGNDLHISGGILWMYDGYLPVEHQFFLYPDNVEVATATTGGNITDQVYFYQSTYEWSDNQGNVFRSAPSLPVKITTTGGNTSANTVSVPTLRLTYKTANPVKIVLYRWSTAQQVYYQVTSITTPVINDTTTDSVDIVDTLADSVILGNNILYTTGGVIENIAAPATDVIALYKSRLILVDAEDKNLLWYSKQVIESTPVEMSDLFTIYVAPTTAAQGNTGPITALSALDDKLIIFKKNALYYLTGTGPDNTGANNDFSEPIFITATVGCDNQHSIVFMPQGLMFQSDKGIWLLGRDLSTTYIGSPVELFTQDSLVQSAVNVPGTNQVRFTLDSGITLMYDYFYGQWGSFAGVPAISSTLYQDLHTYINARGAVFQEKIGSYLDGSNPVLMSFVTGWMNVAGVQGFERAYEFYLIGSYFSPHKLNIGIAYDYNSSPRQTTLITPDNYAPNYGLAPGPYGSGNPYGGPGNLEQWRIFFKHQKCQAFQIAIQEVFDASIGAAAGPGLTMSGIDMTVGVKGGRPKLRASRQAG